MEFREDCKWSDKEDDNKEEEENRERSIKELEEIKMNYFLFLDY